MKTHYKRQPTLYRHISIRLWFTTKLSWTKSCRRRWQKSKSTCLAFYKLRRLNKPNNKLSTILKLCLWKRSGKCITAWWMTLSCWNYWKSKQRKKKLKRLMTWLSFQSIKCRENRKNSWGSTKKSSRWYRSGKIQNCTNFQLQKRFYKN